MKNLSILKDSYAVWIDLSNRDDCVEVIKISNEDFCRLSSWVSIFDITTKTIVEKENNDFVLPTLPEQSEE